MTEWRIEDTDFPGSVKLSATIMVGAGISSRLHQEAKFIHIPETIKAGYKLLIALAVKQWLFLYEQCFLLAALTVIRT